MFIKVTTGFGSRPQSYPMCTGNSFNVIKGPGLEADHSAPSCAEVKNGLPIPTVRHIAYLIRQRDSSTFTIM
jgi:hypothetical protein